MNGIQRLLLSGSSEKLLELERVNALINQYREVSEKERKMHPDIIDALIDAGVHRMWVSRQFGGAQLSLQSGMSIIESIAKLDASAAWLMGVQGALGRLSDYLPEEIARKIFQDNKRLTVGVIAPSGRAERVEGGFILNGRWSFASGSTYANWLACAAVVTEKGQVVMTETGPVIQMLFVAKKDYRLFDDWYTTGLRGTASYSFEVNDVFVPKEYTLAGADLYSPPPARVSRAFAISYNDFGPFTSAPTTLGIAQDALDSFRNLAKAKIPLGGKATLVKSHTAHEKIGWAYSLILSSRLLIENAAQVVMNTEIKGDELSALIRLSASTVALNAKRIVDTLHTMSGATSVYEGDRLERCFRDINTAVKHITLAPASIEMVGQFIMEGQLQVRR